MTDEEMYQALGSLATQARLAKGRNKNEAAAEMGISDSTLRFFELAKNNRFPQVGTLYALEGYYGWRHGVLKELWDDRRSLPAGSLTMDDLLPAKAEGLLKAAHLTDKELMAELQFRFLMRDSRNGGE